MIYLLQKNYKLLKRGKKKMRKLMVLFLILCVSFAVVACSDINKITPTNGVDGKSAYELAVINGYEGTVEEWLASLVGEVGTSGKDGLNGKSAYELAVINGYEGTEEEWIASLVGNKGDDGITPQLKIGDDNYWYVSYDNGTTWVSLNVKATGESGTTGATGKGIVSITFNELGEIIITYTDNSKVNIGVIPVIENDLDYVLLEDGTYGVKAGRGAVNLTKIIIPATYKGQPVTEIMDGGFMNLSYLNTITLPDSLKVIGKYAFYNCFNLKEIKIPAATTRLGEYSFVGCTSLTAVNFENTEGWAFESSTPISKTLNRICGNYGNYGVRKVEGMTFTFWRAYDEFSVSVSLSDGATALKYLTQLIYIYDKENDEIFTFNVYCTAWIIA